MAGPTLEARGDGVGADGRVDRDGKVDVEQGRVAAVLEPQGFADPLSADRSVFVPLSGLEGFEYDEDYVNGYDAYDEDEDEVAAEEE